MSIECKACFRRRTFHVSNLMYIRFDQAELGSTLVSKASFFAVLIASRDTSALRFATAFTAHFCR